MKKKIVIVALLLPILARAGDYGASFLSIGLGARPLAMGGAFVAVADGGSAFYWNPAGLALVRRAGLQGMYGPQFGSISEPQGQFHHLGLTLPLKGQAVIAVNWIRLAVDEIPVYSELQGDSYWDRFHDPSLRPTGLPEGYISDVEDALFFSFGLQNQTRIDLGWDLQKVRVEFPLGFSLKWFRQVLGEGEATGLGLDVGGMCRIYLNDFLQNEHFGIFSLALTLRDVAGSTLGWNTSHEDVIPANLVWGVSYRQPVKALKGAVTLAHDREKRYHGRSRWGLEYSGYNLLALRLGLDAGRICAGAGLHFWRLSVDYAFISHELDNLHRLSCGVRL